MDIVNNDEEGANLLKTRALFLYNLFNCRFKDVKKLLENCIKDASELFASP